MTATRLVRLVWVGMAFLMIGFLVGAQGWANTLEAVKSDIPLPQLEVADEIRLEQSRAVQSEGSIDRRPGFMDGEPRYVDARFDTREEAVERIAAPVVDSRELDPLPPEGTEERLDSQI